MSELIGKVKVGSKLGDNITYWSFHHKEKEEVGEEEKEEPQEKIFQL